MDVQQLPAVEDATFPDIEIKALRMPFGRRIACISLLNGLRPDRIHGDSPLFVLFSDEEIFYADIFHFLRNMSMFTAFVVNIAGEYKSIKSKNNILMS